MLKSAIKVYARIKPNINKRAVTHSYSIQRESTNDDKDLLIVNPSVDSRLSRNFVFKFTSVFPEETSQADFYETVGRPMVKRLLSGYNGAIFAYGQTGTGKTHSIIGDLHSEQTSNEGLITRIFNDVFSIISNSTSEYKLYISSMEIYNEICYDLINLKELDKSEDETPGSFTKVNLMADGKGNLKSVSLKKYQIFSLDDVMKYLRISVDNRVVADTPLNRTSSRSHFIFTLYVIHERKQENLILKSKLHMIDLAGSERIWKRQNSVCLVNEAKYINLSLHYLERVIIALNNSKTYHIPYRNSVLTSLLRDSLGGNCCTTMVFTISMEPDSFNETITTCRFAQRVCLVKNIPRVVFNYDNCKKNCLCMKNFNKSSTENQEERMSRKHNLSSENKSTQIEPNSTSNIGQNNLLNIDSEYIKYTITHINRGINLLSSVLKQCPTSLIEKGFIENNNVNVSQQFIDTLCLNLPEINPFTGEKYTDKQRTAYKEFNTLNSTNEAIMRYLNMNMAYFNFLKEEWRLWNKEVILMEQIKEAELNMKTSMKYGDFPDVIENLKQTIDTYNGNYKKNEHLFKKVKEKKHSCFRMFMDARNKLFGAFEIWWQKQYGSSDTENVKIVNPETYVNENSETNKDLIRDIECDYKTLTNSMNNTSDTSASLSTKASTLTISDSRTNKFELASFHKSGPSSKSGPMFHNIINNSDITLSTDTIDFNKNLDIFRRNKSASVNDIIKSNHKELPLRNTNSDSLIISRKIHLNSIEPKQSSVHSSILSLSEKNITENKHSPLLHSLQVSNKVIENIDQPNTVESSSVKLALTGDADLDSRIIEFYKNQQFSVLF